MAAKQASETKLVKIEKPMSLMSVHPEIKATNSSEAFQIQLQYTSSVLYVKKLVDNAKLPTKQNGIDAGYYIYTPETVYIPPQGYITIDTKIAITIPNGCYCRIASVWQWATSYGLIAAPCVYGPGFTDSVKVVLFNQTQTKYELDAGYNVGVLVVVAISEPQIQEN